MFYASLSHVSFLTRVARLAISWQNSTHLANFGAQDMEKHIWPFLASSVMVEAFCIVSWMVLLEVSHHCYSNTIL